MKHFVVTWTIDVYANDAIEAARQARKAQDAGTEALFFTCEDQDGNVTDVDLLYDDEIDQNNG